MSCVSWVSSESMSPVVFESDCCMVSRIDLRLSTLLAVRKSRIWVASFSTSRRFLSALAWIWLTALSQRSLFSSSVNASIDSA